MTIFHGLPLVSWVIGINPGCQGSDRRVQMDTQSIRIIFRGRNEEMDRAECVVFVATMLRNEFTIYLEDEKEFNDNQREEITVFVQSIRRFQECVEENVRTRLPCNAEDWGFEMLNDNEIVTSVQKESDPDDDETDEDEDNNNESSKGLSNADPFPALETAMEWYEKPTQLLLLKKVRNLAAKKGVQWRGISKDTGPCNFKSPESDDEPPKLTPYALKCYTILIRWK
ncbi:uncharacterized protein TNCV_4951691 [Trichonephila clavipes]|nr:uncharacterized protein TNCV_4951691 [Trichonephila clavipes]